MPDNPITSPDYDDGETEDEREDRRQNDERRDEARAELRRWDQDERY